MLKRQLKRNEERGKKKKERKNEQDEKRTYAGEQCNPDHLNWLLFLFYHCLSLSRCSRYCYSALPPLVRYWNFKMFLRKQNVDISLALLIPQVCCFWLFSVKLCSSSLKYSWKYVSILIKLARGADIWKSLSSACTLMWSLWKLFNPVKQWLK